MKGKRPAITVGIHARMGRVRSLLACVATVAMPILAHAGGVPRFGESPPPSLGGPIDLVDQAGQAFHLSRLSGRSTLVLFGLTHCGTTCPTLLVTAHQVLAASRAEPAVVPFSAVVIVTTLAVQLFDPRKMWDAAEHHQ